MMKHLKNKSISSIVLFINLSLAIVFLFLGAIAIIVGVDLLQTTTIQLVLLFCVAILAFYIASFCFVNGRSIPTQILGDLLKISSFPLFLHKSFGTIICYVFISTLLLWLPLFLSAYFQKNTIPLIGFLVVWVMFYRAADYSERQLLENRSESIK